MASRDTKRPNVIVILTDDQGHWAMGCAGNAEIRTPNLDRLARSGVRFENFFCVSPVCSPARASLLTGRIPSQHGVHDWLRAGNTVAALEPLRSGRLTEYLQGQVGYTDVLAADGYVCGISGKWHLGDSHHPQKGFTFWEVHAKGGGPYYNAPLIHDGELYRAEGYVTDVLTDNALRFLEARLGDDAPFYLSLHYTAPHLPWDRDQHPDEIYDEYYKHCPFKSVPDEPMHPWLIVDKEYGRDPETRRATLSGYFAAVTAMDANVGRVLDWLERNGLRENTLVFFTTDNGMNMGHHGIYGKGSATFPQNMYDTSVKVPAIISRPGHVPEGVVEEGLYSHYDWLPTLLDYLGLECPAESELPGRSFAPLLRGEKLPGRESVVVYDEYGPVRMIRSREFKYVHRYPYGPHEFYDLVNDPEERENRIHDPACRERIREMRAQMEAWFNRYVNPEIDGVRQPVTGRGQLGLVGAAGRGEHNFASAGVTYRVSRSAPPDDPEAPDRWRIGLED